MMTASLPAITLLETDYNRLSALLDQRDNDSATIDGLEEELSRATLVNPSSLPDDIVAMNSLVRFKNEDTGREHELELVYPDQVQGAEGRISILAPAGSALLGLRVGDVMDWPMKGRPALRIKILNVRPGVRG